MKIFLDANILVAVLCNEYPLFTYCARILSLADNPDFEVYTSPLCLAIGYYFAEKKSGSALARKKIALLSEKLSITSMDGETVKKAAGNKAIRDFEDGMQYYSLVRSKCKCIVTQDKKDFYFSEIEVLNAEEFLLKHVAKKR
jgi:predicted nucleic acid-binding protein